MPYKHFMASVYPMTEHSTHGHDSTEHHPDHHHDHDHDHAAMLDLNAQIFGGQLAEIVDYVAGHGPHDGHRPVTSVVDLGAGTGSGTLALARRYPEARVTAVDRSPEMLDRVGAAARAADVATRVVSEWDDLDPAPTPTAPSTRAWDVPASADLIWAASSLHECADPDAVLRRAADALRPGGTVAIVEFVGFPRFLDGTAGQAELRCHDALSRLGWNHYPDWTAQLEAAGLAVLHTVDFTDTPTDASPAAVERCARLQLGRIRSALSDAQGSRDGDTSDDSPDSSIETSRDVAVLDELLAQDPLPADILRPALTQRVWIAHKP